MKERGRGGDKRTKVRVIKKEKGDRKIIKSKASGDKEREETDRVRERAI